MKSTILIAAALVFTATAQAEIGPNSDNQVNAQAVGQPLETALGTVQWVEGGTYQWRTPGNHSDSSTLVMHHVNGDAVVDVKYTDLYTAFEAYTINLSRSTVSVALHSYYGDTDHVEFTMMRLNPYFKPLFATMINRVKDLAAGYPDKGYGSASASPELQPLIQALEHVVAGN